MTTLAEVLAESTLLLAPSATARRDAELLLLSATKLERAALLTHPERALNADELARYRQHIARRAQQEPVQYITGAQEFYGRPFLVTPAVLIPRPETEHLVEAALAVTPPPLHILDVGTGSGILAITLALELPQARVKATDLSTDALQVAQQNAAALAAAERIRFLASDLLARIEGERFDCIVSNPPYVPDGELLEPQVASFEPAAALYAGADGLAVYRRLIPAAAAALEPGGALLLEIGHGQREAVRALLTDSGFRNIRFRDDLQHIPRIAIAQAPIA
jgi:release factor glutamine methyltransferase